MGFASLGEMDINEVLAETRRGEDDEYLFKHEDLTERLKRTLYYDPLKRPDKDTLSFSVTKSAVSCFRDAAPMPFRKLGHRYASRVARDACISPCALLIGLIYIERLKNKNPAYLETVSSSDLFLISMMVASKFLFDEGCKDEVFNDEWAVSGDVEVEKVNKLEREFLSAIEWHLYVHPYEFSSMLNIAESDIALSNGSDRGWLSYSDLRSLLDCQSIYKQLTQTAEILSKATCICMIMYSGLVCLAAITSAALVSVSQTSSSEDRRMNTRSEHTNKLKIGEHNATTESSMLDVEVEETLLDVSFPGFISSSGVLSVRHVDRRRIYQNYQFHNNPPTIVTPRILTRNDKISPTNDNRDDSPNIVQNDQIEIPMTKTHKKPLCAMLEAVIFIAHVPTFFTPEKSSRNTCNACGRLIIPDELPICNRFDKGADLLNCSIHTDYKIDYGILPHMHSLRSPVNKKASGTLNPTVPPIWRSVQNVTNFARTPIVVH